MVKRSIVRESSCSVVLVVASLACAASTDEDCAIDDGAGSTDTRLYDIAFDGAGNLFAVGATDVDGEYHAIVGAWAIP